MNGARNQAKAWVARSQRTLVCCLAGTLLAAPLATRSQDSSRRKTIDITSTFKPVLRNAAKINFNASAPTGDSVRPALSYHIPIQYLSLSLQPAMLKPVPLSSDTLPGWKNDNYIKAGIGSVYQPYLKGAFSFGDQQQQFFNVYADQFSSKGDLPYQKSSLTDVGLNGIVRNSHNMEWTGRFGFSSDGYYLYGYQPDTLKYSKDQLLQRFQTFDGQLGLRNMTWTTYGIGYHPTAHVSVFGDNHSPQATEANTVVDLPLEKKIGDHFLFNLGVTANLTNYRRQNLPAVENNLYYISPSLLFRNANLYIQAGVNPAWDNKSFTLLPDFMAQVSTNDQRFTFLAGWLGYYDKGSYQRFESINPWLAQPNLLLNTEVIERYAGFKGSLDDHFSYAAKVSLLDYYNMPLFVNDSIDGKTFLIRYEPDLKDIQLHGELSYILGEQFSAIAGLTINQYGNLRNNAAAFGLVPLEFKTALRWEVLNDLWIKSDLLAFSGAPWRGNDAKSYLGDGAFDLNAGIEFRIFRQLNLWLQLNNLFNDKYQRWHQYDSYGFNFLLGVIFSFRE